MPESSGTQRIVSGVNSENPTTNTSKMRQGAEWEPTKNSTHATTIGIEWKGNLVINHWWQNSVFPLVRKILHGWGFEENVKMTSLEMSRITIE